MKKILLCLALVFFWICEPVKVSAQGEDINYVMMTCDYLWETLNREMGFSEPEKLQPYESQTRLHSIKFVISDTCPEGYEYIADVTINYSGASKVYAGWKVLDEEKNYDLCVYAPEAIGINPSHLFDGCSNAETIDCSNTIAFGNHPWYMFRGCEKLKNLILPQGLSGEHILHHMFEKCASLETIDLTPLSSVKAADVQYMFSGCSSLTAIDISCLDMSGVTDVTAMFQQCENLESITFGNIDTSKVYYFYDFLSGCKKYNNKNILYELNFNSEYVALNRMLEDTGLTEIDLSPLAGIKKVTLSGIFKNCTGLGKVDMGQLGDCVVTSISEAFRGCTNLTEVDFDGMKVSDELKSLYGLFKNCNKLTAVDLSCFEGIPVTDTKEMFESCKQMVSLDLSSLNTANVTTMAAMFSGCSSLEELDLSGFNTTNVTDISKLFWNCNALKNLDLSSFELTDKLKDVSRVLGNNDSLMTIVTPKACHGSVSVSLMNRNAEYGYINEYGDLCSCWYIDKDTPSAAKLGRGYNVIYKIEDKSIAGVYYYGYGLTEFLVPEVTAGYEFDTWHWNEEKNEPVTGISTQQTGDVTFYGSTKLGHYDIIWTNWDGTVLQEDPDVPGLTELSFKGAVPTRPSNETYDYTFAGWAPEVTNAVANANYVAQYTSTYRIYSITPQFQLDFGTVTVVTQAAVTDMVTVDVTPFSGYRLKEILVHASADATKTVKMADGSFEMPTFPVTVEVVFESIPYDVNLSTVSEFGGCSLSVNTASIGQTVTINVVPDKGCSLDYWRVTAEDPAYTVTVAEDGSFVMPPCAVFVDVGFVRNTYIITVEAPDAEKGTLSVDRSEGYYNDVITVAAEPAEGFAVRAIIIIDEDGKELGVSDTFSMPDSNITIKVKYMVIPTYTVTIPATVELDGEPMSLSLDDVVMEDGVKLQVTLSTDLKVGTAEGAVNTYKINAGAITDGCIVLSVDGGGTPANPKSGAVDLYFTRDEDPKYSGDYKGIISFNISIIDNAYEYW